MNNTNTKSGLGGFIVAQIIIAALCVLTTVPFLLSGAPWRGQEREVKLGSGLTQSMGIFQMSSAVSRDGARIGISPPWYGYGHRGLMQYRLTVDESVNIDGWGTLTLKEVVRSDEIPPPPGSGAIVVAYSPLLDWVDIAALLLAVAGWILAASRLKRHRLDTEQSVPDRQRLWVKLNVTGFIWLTVGALCLIVGVVRLYPMPDVIRYVAVALVAVALVLLFLAPRTLRSLRSVCWALLGLGFVSIVANPIGIIAAALTVTAGFKADRGHSGT